MGAGRERLVRQLMTESVMLAFAGGVLGIAVAAAAVPLLTRLVPDALPIAETPAVDVRVLMFAALLTAATGLLFGVAPVLRVGTDPDAEGLREGARAGGGRKDRLRSALVVAEIVASVVLLVSAGLLMRALWTVHAIDPGFKGNDVVMLRTALPNPQYAPPATREAFYRRVLDEVRVLPGVAGAAYVTAAPLTFRAGIFPVSVTGQPITREATTTSFLRFVTPGYFDTLGIPIKRGRDISESDAGDRPHAAVVSESFVRRHFPNDDPIGRHFNFVGDDRVIVGVVGDVRMRGIERPSEPQVYLSYKQIAERIVYYVPNDLVVRSSAPAALVPSIRAIVRNADPKLPISDVALLSDVVDLDTTSRSAQLRVLVSFAAIAFVLAAVGIHGLLSFAVSQRAKEIGVRMALGAQQFDILRMVMLQSVWLSGAGVVPGLALAYAAGRSMQALLAGVTPADVRTFAVTAALTIVMTLIGTLMPTLRALRVDPITALRTE
jgi:putative ABC transport system permease protein